MILITTAGKVGSAAARLIAQRDAPVRVQVRHPERVAALAQAGVEIFPGDLDSPESVDRAMRGVSRVATAIVTTSPTMCHRSSAGRPAHSSSSPSTTPRRSHEGKAATA
jgi:nucleoside-diphosphate-sugar epimerase